jgi:predicted kinase
MADAELLECHGERGRLMLTCGLPGAGKTALAMQLAADRSALRVTKDEWLIALGSNPWDEPTRVKLEHELWHLAQEVLRLGRSVVLDFGLWARSERDEFRAAARGLGAGVELHYLDVPTDELWRRIHARNAEPPGTATRLAAPTSTSGQRFQAPDAAELALFDPPPRLE